MTQNTAEAIWEKIRKGVFVIAEAGKNFIQTEEEKSTAEYLRNAIQLVDAAVKAGADAIKFQTHRVADEQLNIEVTSPHFKGSDRYRWVARNSAATPLNEFWRPLKQHCDQQGIIFFSTPMSRGAAQCLDELNIPLWKIGSGDILDFVMLDHIRASGLPIILSSGMSTLEEVDRAVRFLKEKNERIALLHCVSKYPCPAEDLNLKSISFYQERFAMPIGFSDHSMGIESALAAVAMGATVIEKHFSLSRALWGSDHRVSLIPGEFASLIAGVHEVLASPIRRKEVMENALVMSGMGNPKKELQDSEAVFRPLFRKSLMAACAIEKGVVLTSAMLYAMRPQQYAGGLPSEAYESVIGRRLKRSLKKYEPISADSII